MKCGAGKADLFATPSCAPQGVLKGDGGPENHRRPLKPLWAEQSDASKRSEYFGPLVSVKF